MAELEGASLPGRRVTCLFPGCIRHRHHRLHRYRNFNTQNYLHSQLHPHQQTEKWYREARSCQSLSWPKAPNGWALFSNLTYLLANNRRNTNAGIMKKGRKEIAPKRPSLVKANNLIKVFPLLKPFCVSLLHIFSFADDNRQKLGSQLAAGTERHLAQKAGHLELLAGGKKDNKKPAPEVKKA